MQARAWANLPILNQWRQRCPEQDPLALHAAHWQTTLRCPGGGRYVWNEEYQTMASTVYGHPGEPQGGPLIPPSLSRDEVRQLRPVVSRQRPARQADPEPNPQTCHSAMMPSVLSKAGATQQVLIGVPFLSAFHRPMRHRADLKAAAGCGDSRCPRHSRRFHKPGR